MVPIAALLLIPLLTAVGLSVDYSRATRTKASMQNALDAASLAILTMSVNSTLEARQAKLQDVFASNGGEGTATLDEFSISNTGAATVKASADYAMPTTFMRIARIGAEETAAPSTGDGAKAAGATASADSAAPAPSVGISIIDAVDISAASAVNKAPSLIEAKFKVKLASGHWDKTMTLYGQAYNAAKAKKLMEITYVREYKMVNGAKVYVGDPKGYGTMTANKITTSANGVETATQAQKQECKTVVVTSFPNPLPAGVITQTSGGTKYKTTCTITPATGEGAVIDVSDMAILYLEMNVPSAPTPKPKIMRTDDPVTSNRLYIEGVEVATGVPVDIFSVVPCGMESSQAWEDGGTNVPTLAANKDKDADFFYSVTGRCDFNKRPSRTAMTK